MKRECKLPFLRLVIMDNRDSFSYNLYHLFQAIEYVEVEVISSANLTSDQLDDVDALILSPGPGLPCEHHQMKRIIRDWHARIPILGVCLGHQALIEFFGGKLKQLELVKHGIQSQLQIDDRSILWRGIERAEAVGRYHSWIATGEDWPVDLLVTSRDEEGMIMSFRHRRLPIYGVQFHPESYMTSVGDQLAINFIDFLWAQRPADVTWNKFGW